MKEKIEKILFAYKVGSMNINEASQQVLDLFAVNNRREQLIAFAQWLAHKEEYNKDGSVGTVDTYLESN